MLINLHEIHSLQISIPHTYDWELTGIPILHANFIIKFPYSQNSTEATFKQSKNAVWKRKEKKPNPPPHVIKGAKAWHLFSVYLYTCTVYLALPVPNDHRLALRWQRDQAPLCLISTLPLNVGALCSVVIVYKLCYINTTNTFPCFHNVPIYFFYMVFHGIQKIAVVWVFCVHHAVILYIIVYPFMNIH